MVPQLDEPNTTGCAKPQEKLHMNSCGTLCLELTIQKKPFQFHWLIKSTKTTGQLWLCASSTHETEYITEMTWQINDPEITLDVKPFFENQITPSLDKPCFGVHKPQQTTSAWAESSHRILVQILVNATVLPIATQTLVPKLKSIHSIPRIDITLMKNLNPMQQALLLPWNGPNWASKVRVSYANAQYKSQRGRTLTLLLENAIGSFLNAKTWNEI